MGWGITAQFDNIMHIIAVLFAISGYGRITIPILIGLIISVTVKHIAIFLKHNNIAITWISSIIGGAIPAIWLYDPKWPLPIYLAVPVIALSIPIVHTISTWIFIKARIKQRVARILRFGTSGDGIGVGGYNGGTGYNSGGPDEYTGGNHPENNPQRVSTDTTSKGKTK